MCVCVACFLVGCDTEDDLLQIPDDASKELLHDLRNYEIAESLDDEISQRIAENFRAESGDPNNCNCTFVIRSIRQINSNGSISAFDGTFSTRGFLPNNPNSFNCNGHCDSGNTLFELEGNSRLETCPFTFVSGDCVQKYNFIEEKYKSQSFFCLEIPKYQDFTLLINPRRYTNSPCIVSGPANGSSFQITYQFICGQSGETPNPPVLGGTPDCNSPNPTIYGPIFTETIPSSNFGVTSVPFTLNGCGCEPEKM